MVSVVHESRAHLAKPGDEQCASGGECVGNSRADRDRWQFYLRVCGNELMETNSAQHVLEIRQISYVEVLNSPALLAEYGAECSIPEIGSPDPQRETYARMESSGLMHSFGVFDGLELVGFASILVFVLPHYGKKIANVESLFLANSHRRGNAGTRLMRHIEAWVKQEQCVAVLYNARAGTRLERLLNAFSRYKRTNSVFLWSAS